ncbi:hypothetical protein FRC01_005832 [Tulasnella sp. 417]|nr:hypothetical protein FRC01_005832 [Tulasnella sp. 417]
MTPWEKLPACVAVRAGRRPTVYMTVDEAIFALEGWPRPEFAICKQYYQAVNYLNLEPMDYPRWLRIIIWPETAGDMSEPTVPEASETEFRNAFIRMREMGYPEDRFPPWFTEKILDEDYELARQITQAPVQAPTSIQSEWVIHFGPDQLSHNHWVWGSAADYAASSARALAARAQLSLRWGHPLREKIKDPGLRHYPASVSHMSSTNAPAGLGDIVSTGGSTSHGEIGQSQVITWLAENGVRSGESLDNQDGSGEEFLTRLTQAHAYRSILEDSEPSIFGCGPYIEQEEVNPIWWTLPSAPLNLTPTSALILGAPGSGHERFAREFNPAIQRVNLWGIDDGDLQMPLVDACLGPVAARYFHHHYYSHGSKAVIIRAYWYHHQDVDHFVKHLFRRGVLPMLAAYMWELLQASFNWKVALEIGLGRKDAEGSGSLRSVDAEKLDFANCPECEGREILMVTVERAQPGSKGEEKAHK